jgi:hypothetical protein
MTACNSFYCHSFITLFLAFFALCFYTNVFVSVLYVADELHPLYHNQIQHERWVQPPALGLSCTSCVTLPTHDQFLCTGCHLPQPCPTPSNIALLPLPARFALLNHMVDAVFSDPPFCIRVFHCQLSNSTWCHEPARKAITYILETESISVHPAYVIIVPLVVALWSIWLICACWFTWSYLRHADRTDVRKAIQMLPRQEEKDD